MKTSNRSPAINGELGFFFPPPGVFVGPTYFSGFRGHHLAMAPNKHSIHWIYRGPHPRMQSSTQWPLRCFLVANPKLNLHLASWHPGWGLGDPDPIHTSFSLFFFQKKPDENRTPELMNWFQGNFLHSSQHECCYPVCGWRNCVSWHVQSHGKNSTPVWDKWNFQTEPRKRTFLLSMKYWLFSRDPYVMVYSGYKIPNKNAAN